LPEAERNEERSFAAIVRVRGVKQVFDNLRALNNGKASIRQCHPSLPSTMAISSGVRTFEHHGQAGINQSPPVTPDRSRITHDGSPITHDASTAPFS